MHKKGVILLSSLMFLPSFNNLNINATNINDYLVEVIEGSNFKFEYKTYSINKVQDVPFSMIGVADIINMPSTLHYKFNYSNIDYKELFMNNINSNYADLMIYRKELIYFVEVSGNYQDELVFHDPTRTSVDILIDIDGNDNKFGVYLMTLNAKEIIQRYMVVDFTIDNKTYEFNFKYNDYYGINWKLNYFETVNEYNEFCYENGF